MRRYTVRPVDGAYLRENFSCSTGCPVNTQAGAYVQAIHSGDYEKVKDVLLKAYASGAQATDDAALVEAIGHPVHVVLGDPRNVKITTPGDLAMAEAMLAGAPR